MANILWMGGEDIDFPNGAALNVDTTSGRFRSGYARCAVSSSTGGSISKSLPFPGGAVTSAWLSFQWAVGPGLALGNISSPAFGKSGTNFCLGIGSGSSNSKLALFKYDGSTLTQLAAEAGTSIPGSGPLRVDIQLISYGASATVNVFISGAGAPLFSFTGDVTVGGNTSVDSVFLARSATGEVLVASEIIVSDSDTRAMSLVTQAPNGNGATQNWSNPGFANIDPTTINDANATFVNTTAQDTEYTVNGAPSGNFSVVAVKQIARGMMSSGSTPTGLKQGLVIAGTIYPGSAHSLSGSFQPVEDYLTANPATGIAFTQADINAYGLDLRSN